MARWVKHSGFEDDDRPCLVISEARIVSVGLSSSTFQSASDEGLDPICSFRVDPKQASFEVEFEVTDPEAERALREMLEAPSLGDVDDAPVPERAGDIETIGGVQCMAVECSDGSLGWMQVEQQGRSLPRLTDSQAALHAAASRERGRLAVEANSAHHRRFQDYMD